MVVRGGPVESTARLAEAQGLCSRSPVDFTRQPLFGKCFGSDTRIPRSRELRDDGAESAAVQLDVVFGHIERV